MSQEPLHLMIDAERMRRFCEQAARAAPDGGRLLSTLLAVQTFISATVRPDARAAEGYTLVQEVLEEAVEAAQERVLDEHGANLARAIIARAPQGVAKVHGTLSRGGFAEAVAKARRRLTAEDDESAGRWAVAWTTEARRCAEAASGYPGALDFAAGDIDHRDYAAMADLARAFH